MTTLFEDDDFEIIPSSSASLSASERAERAKNLLDEIGLISGSAHITSAAILFVEDMQKRLQESRDRKTEFFCSERQLEWLEHIYEKVS